MQTKPLVCVSSFLLKFMIGSIISVIKIAIYFPIVLLMLVYITLFTVLMIIPNIFAAIYTIIVSPKYGPTMKLILLLTSIKFAFIYQFVISIILSVSTVFSQFYLCFETCMFLCTAENIYTYGIFKTELLHIFYNSIADIINCNIHSYFLFLKELRDSIDGEKIDIPIHRIFFVIFVTIIGIVTNIIATTILSIVKFPMMIARHIIITVQIFQSFTCERNNLLFIGMAILFIPMFVILAALIIIGNITFVIFTPIWAFFNGSDALITYIDTFSLGASMKKICTSIYKTDVAMNKHILNTENDISILKCMNFEISPIVPNVNYTNEISEEMINEAIRHFRVSSQIISNVNNTQPSISRIGVLRIWDDFFDMCTSVTTDSIRNNMCSIEDVECNEPYLIVGIPSVVIFKILQKSHEISGFMLLDGTIVDETNRPINSFSTSMYQSLIDIKHKLRQLNLNTDELIFFEKWLLTLGCISKCNTANILALKLVEMNRVSSLIQSISLNISKMPTFLRRIGESMRLAIENSKSATISSTVSIV